MPSVRDTLKLMLAGRGADQQQQRQDQQVGQGRPDPLPQGPPGEPGVGQDAGQGVRDDMIERLRAVADQRAALAQSEINRRQEHLHQLQDRLEEVTKQGLPPGNLTDDIDEAGQRLNEAKADLARANEARKNTDLTLSLKQETADASLAASMGGMSVREKLGKGGPVLGGDEGMELRARAPSRRM